MILSEEGVRMIPFEGGVDESGGGVGQAGEGGGGRGG